MATSNKKRSFVGLVQPSRVKPPQDSQDLIGMSRFNYQKALSTPPEQTCNDSHLAELKSCLEKVREYRNMKEIRRDDQATIKKYAQIIDKMDAIESMLKCDQDRNESNELWAINRVKQLVEAIKGMEKAQRSQLKVFIVTYLMIFIGLAVTFSIPFWEVHMALEYW